MKSLAILTAASLVFITLAASAAERAPAPEARNLTGSFAEAGLAIDRLQVYEIGGIVLIRGRAYSKADSEQADRVAQALGYNRIANLVEVIPPPDDRAIERRAERELTIHRSLDGCRFKVDARQGVVHVAGTVHYELQKDMAIHLLRNIDGVREVRSELNRD